MRRSQVAAYEIQTVYSISRSTHKPKWRYEIRVRKGANTTTSRSLLRFATANQAFEAGQRAVQQLLRR